MCGGDLTIKEASARSEAAEVVVQVGDLKEEADREARPQDLVRELRRAGEARHTARSPIE